MPIPRARKRAGEVRTGEGVTRQSPLSPRGQPSGPKAVGQKCPAQSLKGSLLRKESHALSLLNSLGQESLVYRCAAFRRSRLHFPATARPLLQPKARLPGLGLLTI